MGVGRYLIGPIVILSAAFFATTVFAQEPEVKVRQTAVKTGQLSVKKSVRVKATPAWAEDIEIPRLSRGVDPSIIHWAMNRNQHQAYGVEEPNHIYTEENLRAVRKLASEIGGKFLSSLDLPFLRVVEAGLQSANDGIDNLTPEMQGEKYRFDYDLELNLHLDDPLQAVSQLDRKVDGAWRRFIRMEVGQEKARFSLSVPLRRHALDFNMGYSNRIRRRDGFATWMPGYEGVGLGSGQKEGFSIGMNCRVKLGR